MPDNIRTVHTVAYTTTAAKSLSTQRGARVVREGLGITVVLKAMLLRNNTPV
jgi:hypothetical protein